MEMENLPSKEQIEKEMMEVTEENKTEDVPRATTPRLPTWDELPDWAKKLVPGELIPFKGHFFKFVGMTPDLAVVLKYDSPTNKTLKE